jgi:hypothetical protein
MKFKRDCHRHCISQYSSVLVGKSALEVGIEISSAGESGLACTFLEVQEKADLVWMYRAV